MSEKTLMWAEATSGILTVSFLAWYATVLMPWNEQRPELVEIPDPILPRLPRKDVSWPVTTILYTAGARFLWNWDVWDPMHACWTFLLLMMTRALILWLHPFRAPHDVIPLRDPLVERFVGTTQPLVCDLSISGHMMQLMAFYLLMPGFEWFYGLSMLVTGVLMMVGRVHLTGDLCIAIPVAYWCVQIADDLFRWWQQRALGWWTLVWVVTWGWPVYQKHYGLRRPMVGRRESFDR